jgi:hypothetical protein
MARLVPNYAGRDTLATRAKIDCRTDDMLSVSVRIHKNHPSGTPTVKQSNYNKNTSEEMKLQTVIKYLSTDSGLAMTAPKVPRYLLKTGNELDLAVEKLSETHRQWHNELVNRVKADFDVVRDVRNGVVDNVLLDALEWVWKHLLKATSTDSPLWKEAEEVTDKWSDLLCTLGSKITSDKHTPEKADSPFHSYNLLLRGANRLMTHILAAQIWSYESLKQVDPHAAKVWTQQILGDERDTDSTQSDSSSSDSDGAKSPPPPAWKTSGKRAQHKQRRAQATPRRVADFERKFMVGETAERFGADTTLPLLALSTTIRVRAWCTRYITCLVDNFESMGSDVNNLAADPDFVKMSTSIPGLTHPTAAWCVNQHNGGADVTIFIREDASDALPTLNDKIKALLPSSTPNLRMRTTFKQPDENGRIHNGCKTVTVCLNQVVPVVPNRKRPDRSSTTPPLPFGSFAQAAMRGFKRLSDNPTLNHRPNKKQAEDDEHKNGWTHQQRQTERPQPQQSHQQRQQQNLPQPHLPQNQVQQQQQQQPQQTNQQQPPRQQQAAQHNPQAQHQPPKQKKAPQQQPAQSHQAPSTNYNAVSNDHFTSSPAWKALQADNAKTISQVKAQNEQLTTTTAKFASDMNDLSNQFAEQLTKTNQMIRDNQAHQTDALDNITKGARAKFDELTQQNQELSAQTRALSDQNNNIQSILAQIAQHLNLKLVITPQPTPHLAMIMPITEMNENNAAASPASNGSAVANV